MTTSSRLVVPVTGRVPVVVVVRRGRVVAAAVTAAAITVKVGDTRRSDEATPVSSRWWVPAGVVVGIVTDVLTLPSESATTTASSSGSEWSQTWTCSPGRKPWPDTVI